MAEKIHDSHRGRSASFSAAMSASAERRKCPNCERKSALTKVETDTGRARVCRWCGYERVWDSATGELVETWPQDKTAALREP